MSWLTRFLGYDTSLHLLEATIADYHETLINRDQEIQRLTNLMLMEHGVIHPEGAAQEPKEAPRSINRRPSWNQVKTRYEEADSKLAAEQSGKLREYWLKKDQEASKEGMVI